MTKSSRAARRILVADLIGSIVEDDSGKSVGRVIDIEVRPKARWEVVNLLLGAASAIDRVNILRATPNRAGDLRPFQTVPWSAVERFEDGRIRLAPGIQPAETTPVTPDGTAGERGDPTGSTGPQKR